jgi:hypothetical protein
MSRVFEVVLPAPKAAQRGIMIRARQPEIALRLAMLDKPTHPGVPWHQKAETATPWRFAYASGYP